MTEHCAIEVWNGLIPWMKCENWPIVFRHLPAQAFAMRWTISVVRSSRRLSIVLFLSEE